jgi:tripartite ATP-independent transporter DctP family solute receptor
VRKLLLATTAIAFGLSAAAPAFAEFNDRNIRVSNGINEDHPVGNGIKAMQACLDQKSGGKLKLTAFWGGALGGDLQATQALRSGVQEAVVTSSSPLVGIIPALGVFDLPFLFANAQEAYTVLDGDFGDMMNEKLEAAGLVNLAYWENGFRNLSNSVRPVTKWEDFEGMKVRVMQNNIFLDTFQNLGANATPMAFGEVFSALETKAIDSYTPEEQAALRECAVVGRDEERKVIQDLNKKSLEKIKEAGLEVNTLSAEEQARIREKSMVVYEKHKAEIGADVVDAILAKLAEIRK